MNRLWSKHDGEVGDKIGTLERSHRRRSWRCQPPIVLSTRHIACSVSTLKHPDACILPMSTFAVSSKVKSRRTTRACDFCHKRGRRCKKDTEGSLQCTTCLDFGVACTWSRVPAKRGTKPRSGNRAASWTLTKTKHGSIALMEKLIDNFFEAVYPVFAPPLSSVQSSSDNDQGYNDPWEDV